MAFKFVDLQDFGAKASGRRTYKASDIKDAKTSSKYPGFVLVKWNDGELGLIPASHAKKATEDSLFEAGTGKNGRGKYFLEGSGSTIDAADLEW